MEHDADKRGERRWMNRAEVVVGEWRKHGGRERRSSAGKRRTVGEGSSWDGGVAGGQCESFLRLFQWAARRKRRNVNKKAGISNNGRIYPTGLATDRDRRLCVNRLREWRVDGLGRFRQTAKRTLPSLLNVAEPDQGNGRAG